MRTLPDTVLGELQPPVTVKMVHGIITSFRRTTGSRDRVSCEIVQQPFLAQQFRIYRFFVNKTVPEVVEQVLVEHGLKGWTFISRLLSEVGIFYFFTLQPDTQAVLMFDKMLAINSPSAISDSKADSVRALNMINIVVEGNVTTKDYNHR